MVLHPVGPEPASTYWRRRSVLLVMSLVVLLLLRSCVGGGSSPRRTGDAKPTATPSPSASPASRVSSSPSPTASAATVSASRPCADTELRLVVSTDDTSYPVGSAPTFTLVVTNTSATPCTRDLGPTAVSLLVVSGTARQWSSDDCQPASGHEPTVLAPGKATQVARIQWSGKKSQVGCPSPRESASAGTYQVSGRLGTLTSARAVFHFR